MLASGPAQSQSSASELPLRAGRNGGAAAGGGAGGGGGWACLLPIAEINSRTCSSEKILVFGVTVRLCTQ